MLLKLCWYFFYDLYFLCVWCSFYKCQCSFGWFFSLMTMECLYLCLLISLVLVYFIRYQNNCTRLLLRDICMEYLISLYHRVTYISDIKTWLCSLMKKNDTSYFHIHSVTLSLFIGAMRSLILRDINEHCLLIPVICCNCYCCCGGGGSWDVLFPSYDLLALSYLFPVFYCV